MIESSMFYINFETHQNSKRHVLRRLKKSIGFVIKNMNKFFYFINGVVVWLV